MAPTPVQVEQLMLTLEQALTARNLEIFREQYPDSGWPEPEISYSEWLATYRALWRECVPAVHAQVVASGPDGRAVIEFEEMVAPVVTVGQTTPHLVIVEAVTEDSVTVRVLDGVTGVAGVAVHVTVTDAGVPAGS